MSKSRFVTEKVLAIVRRLPEQRPVVLLINFDDGPVKIDARAWLNIPEKLLLYVASIKSGLELDASKQVDTTNFNLPGAASVILY